MTILRGLAALLLAAALMAVAAGMPQPRAAVAAEGYQVLAADFHNHSFPGDWATLAPWDVMYEAQRSHLDVVALTSHNHVWAGLLGRFLARGFDAPLILAGEEIVRPAPHYHLLAIGIHSSIDSRMSAGDAIDEIHRQGGVAIAAHPIHAYSSNYDAAARPRLDGAEVLHPVAYEDEKLAGELREFYSSGNFAAIGDSDYRGLGAAGICRTLVFVRERTEQGVLDAIRERHTVVFGQGRYYGDPQLIELVKRQPSLLIDVPDPRAVNGYSAFSRIAGGVGLFMLILLGPGGLRPRRWPISAA